MDSPLSKKKNVVCNLDEGVKDTQKGSLKIVVEGHKKLTNPKEFLERKSNCLPSKTGTKSQDTHHEIDSECNGSSDTFHMASLESFRSFSVTLRPSDQDPSWQVSPSPKMEKDKCILKESLGQIYCFKHMFFWFCLCFLNL